MSSLESIRYQERGVLSILDQLKLPHTIEYIPIQSVQDGFNVIRNMQVRGAPAIAIVGCLSLAVELHNATSFASVDALMKHIRERTTYLISSRPTAVNLQNAVQELVRRLETAAQDDTVASMIKKVTEYAEEMLRKDRADNFALGEFGAEEIMGRNSGAQLGVLTHCNTGSLATAGYGTALGVIRSLHKRGKLERAFYTETRPYNQGARLTGFELLTEKIPATLICDSMAGWLMKTRPIHAVVTGADRVARNGDTANKIGTYALAVLAKEHGVPFYIAMPLTTFDPALESGAGIRIEERPWTEMLQVGGVKVAAEGTECWNPAFDITPASLITGGIITELGVFSPHSLAQNIQRLCN